MNVSYVWIGKKEKDVLGGFWSRGFVLVCFDRRAGMSIHLDAQGADLLCDTHICSCLLLTKPLYLVGNSNSSMSFGIMKRRRFLQNETRS